jgi:hypothetical protein
MAKKDLPAVDFQAVLARRDPKLAERLAREGIAPEATLPAPPPVLVAVPTTAAANTEVSLPATEQPGPDVASSPTAANGAPAGTRKRGLVSRADGREAGRITVYVPPELALRLRKYCFERDQTITDVAAEVLVQALELRLRAG